MTKRILTAAVLAAVLVAVPVSAQTGSESLPEYRFRFIPGAFIPGAVPGTVDLTIGCAMDTPNPTWAGRNSIVHLHLKIVEQNLDGSYGTHGVYSSRDRSDPTALTGSMPCNLYEGVSAVRFRNVLPPHIAGRAALARLKVIARFYHGNRFPAMRHQGLFYTGRWNWIGYPDNVHDGPGVSEISAGEEYDFQ